jgi:hypothetical protein
MRDRHPFPSMPRPMQVVRRRGSVCHEVVDECPGVIAAGSGKSSDLVRMGRDAVSDMPPICRSVAVHRSGRKRRAWARGENCCPQTQSGADNPPSACSHTLPRLGLNARQISRSIEATDNATQQFRQIAPISCEPLRHPMLAPTMPPGWRTECDTARCTGRRLRATRRGCRAR